MRINTVAAAVAVALLIVPACGDDADTAPEGPRRVEIELSDFEFDPDLASVMAGQTVEFIVTNNGAVEHEFRVTNQAEIDAHIEGGHEEHTDDTDEMDEMDDMDDTDDMDDMDDMDEPMLIIPPGETMTLTVTFPEDSTMFTRFVCLIPGHYEAGMVGEIVYSG